MIDYKRLQNDLTNGLKVYEELSTRQIGSGIPTKVPIQVYNEYEKRPNTKFRIFIGNNGQVGSLISLDGWPEEISHDEWDSKVKTIWQQILDARKERV